MKNFNLWSQSNIGGCGCGDTEDDWNEKYGGDCGATKHEKSSGGIKPQTHTQTQPTHHGSNIQAKPPKHWGSNIQTTHRFGQNWKWNSKWGKWRGFGRFAVGPRFVDYEGRHRFGWWNEGIGFVPFSWSYLCDAGWTNEAINSYYLNLVGEGVEIDYPPPCYVPPVYVPAPVYTAPSVGV